MFINIRIVADAEEVAREIGVPLPRGAEYRVPFPVRGRLGIVERAPDGPGNVAPAALLRWIYDHLPRYALGAPCTDGGGILRRHAVMPSAPTKRPMVDDWDGEATRLEAIAHAHFVEALGLPRSTELGEEGIYPWDEIGQRLDEAHQAKVDAERRERERQERQRAERDRPNTKSVGDLNTIAVELPKKAFVLDGAGVLCARGPRVHETMRVAASRAVEETEDAYIFLVDVSPLEGLLPPEGPLPAPYYGRFLPRDYVPAVPKHVLEEKTLTIERDRTGAWFALRRCPKTKVERDRLLDLRTAEGNHAAQRLREIIAPRAVALADSGLEPRPRLFLERRTVQEGVRGLTLNPEALYAVYADAVTPHLGMVAVPPKEERAYFTEDGRSVPAHEVRRVPPGLGHTMPGRPYRDLEPVFSRDGVVHTEWLREELVLMPQPPKRAPLPMGRERFLSLVREALEPTESPWVDIGELLATPSEDFIARWFRRLSGEDARWVDVLRAATDGKEQVPPVELERAVIAAGLVSGKFKPADYGRLRRLMTDELGWTTRQLATDDGRARMWCRT